MIRDWEDIDRRYNEIKNHKPKQPKKISELAEILASAYIIDSDAAIKMWEYIVDLNISDNIKNAKFYVAQVFNKILNILENIEAANFIGMSDKLLRLFYKQGYDIGGTFIACSKSLVNGYIILGDYQKALEVINYIINKDSDIDDLNNRKYHVIVQILEDINVTQNKYKNDRQVQNTIEKFILELMNIDDEYMYILIFTNKIKETSNEELASINGIEQKIKYCCEKLIEISEFERCFSLFRILEIKIEDIEIIEFWEEIIYLENIRDTVIKPRYDEDLQWFANLVLKSKVLVDYYINGKMYNCFEKNIINQSIINRDWENFSYVLYRMISLCQDERIRSLFSDFLNTIFDLCDTESILVGSNGMSIDKNDVDDIIYAMIKSLKNAYKGNFYNDYLDQICRGIIRLKKDSNILKSCGLYNEFDKNSSVNRLLNICKYKIDNMDDDQKIDHRYDQSVNNRIGEILREARQEYGTKGYDFEYKIAEYEDICKYLFLHNAHMFSLKAKIIYSCIIFNNLEKALYLLDLLKETSKYPDYNISNSWEMEFTNTIYYVVKYAKSDIEYGYSDGVGVSNEQILNLKYLVQITYDYLDIDSISKIKISLAHILNEDENKCMDETTNKILHYIDLYTSNHNDTNINTTTSIISDGLEVLIRKGKINVLSTIIDKFIESQNIIKGPSLNTWISMIVRSYYMEKYNYYKLTRLNPEIIDIIIDSVGDYEILKLIDIFKEYGEKREIDNLKEKITIKRGSLKEIGKNFNWEMEHE